MQITAELENIKNTTWEEELIAKNHLKVRPGPSPVLMNQTNERKLWFNQNTIFHYKTTQTRKIRKIHCQQILLGGTKFQQQNQDPWVKLVIPTTSSFRVIDLSVVLLSSSALTATSTPYPGCLRANNVSTRTRNWSNLSDSCATQS